MTNKDFSLLSPKNNFNPVINRPMFENLILPNVDRSRCRRKSNFRSSRRNLFALINLFTVFGKYFYYGGSFAFVDHEPDSDINLVCRASDIDQLQLHKILIHINYTYAENNSEHPYLDSEPPYLDINSNWLYSILDIKVQICGKRNLKKYFKACKTFAKYDKSYRKNIENWNYFYENNYLNLKDDNECEFKDERIITV